MKKGILSFVVLAGVLAWGTAQAATPCCQVKPCPTGKTAVKGSSAAAAKCCTDVTNPATCTNLYAAGYVCDAMGPGNSDGTGCTEIPGGDASGTCAGGNAAGPAGCIAVGGGAYVTSTSATSGANGNAAECTRDAVDACCEAGSCH
jgi:hypothetical protein